MVNIGYCSDYSIDCYISDHETINYFGTNNYCHDSISKDHQDSIGRHHQSTTRM